MNFGVPMPPNNNRGNIPPPPPRGGNNNGNNNNGNFRGGRGGAGRGGRGRGRGGRVGGRGGRGGGNNHNPSMRNMNRYGPSSANASGNGNVPPPPPPMPNRQNDMNMRNNNNGNWRGSDGGRNMNNNRNAFGRNNNRGGRGRGGGGGNSNGGGHGGPGNMRGRGRGGDGRGGGHGNNNANGNGRFHHQHPQQHQNQHQHPQQQQGPAGQGQFPPGPPHQHQLQHQQQQGYVPPPPPHSNFGAQTQHHQHSNPMMRSGAIPPPPPPNQPHFHQPQQNMQHLQNQQHQHQQPSIPPPPPKVQQSMGQIPPWQANMSSPPFQSQQQYPHQAPPYLQPNQQQQQQQIPVQHQFPAAQRLTQHHQQQAHVQQIQTLPSLNSAQYQQQQQPSSHHQLQQHHQASTQIAYTQQHQQQQKQPFPLTTQPSNPTAPAQSTDPEHNPKNWSTHEAPSGVNYFFNNVTQKSTYDQPLCLSQNSATTQIPVATNTANTNATTTSNQSKERGWTQHTDKASGKVYYYNGVITTWEKPQDFVDSTPKRPDKNSTSTQPKKKRKKDNVQKEEVSLYSNKLEAVAAFKGLLLAKDISPTMKWNDVIKTCSSDSRWNACSSMGERKQALAEYQTKRAAELREQKRQEKVRAKDCFMKLLTDILPRTSFNPSANTRFEDIRDSLSTDDRFYAVEDEETRHDLYFDFLEELRKREERQRRGKKRESKDSFLAFLKSREEIGSLTFASTWSAFIITLNDKDKEDPRFAISPSMSDSDRQLYFADYVIELNTAEEEKKRRILDARRRAEKAQRNAYRDTLRSMAKEGKILPSSRWRNCEEELISHSSFGPVNDQDRNAPRDMFEDFVYDWADAYRRDKSFLNSLVETSKDAVVESESKYDNFKEAILKAAAYSPDVYSDARRVINEEDPVSSAKLYFDEMVMRAKTGNAMISKRRGPYGRHNDDSSEDEGEIVEEDGEVAEEPKAMVTEAIRVETPESEALKKEDDNTDS